MPRTPVACRLFVILAREAPIGLIFRRGPSKWTQLIKWHTNSDIFESGAWFHGQIYPPRSDLSPDGSKLIYFATNYDYLRKVRGNEFPPEWTAISKVPWLTALCAWPNPGTYYGGGLFETDTKVWINQGMWRQLANGFIPPPDLEVSYDHPFYDHRWHNLFRLERDGWKPIKKYPAASVPLFRLQPDGSVTVEPSDSNCQLLPPGDNVRAVHEKPDLDGSRSLIMTSRYFYTSKKVGQTSKLSI